MSTVSPTQPARAFGPDIFNQFNQRRQQPDWMAAARRQAFEAYQERLDIPLDPEEWKRVDLRPFRADQFAPVDSPGELPAQAMGLEQETEFAGQVAHVDGHCVSTRCLQEYTDQGVLFGSLGDLLAEHRELLEPHWMKRAVPMTTDRFSAWHAAYWTGGTLLYVPRGVELDQPLHSLIALSTDGAADFSHTLVILEEGARATLLEETASAGEDTRGLHVGAVELLLAPGSHLRYVQLQNWSPRTWHFAHQAGRVDRDAHLQWTVGGIGARLAHIHQNVNLDGRGAQAEVNGVTFATARQLLSYYTHQAHNQPDTRSDLLYKQVLRDRARIAWRGMIRVEPEAQRINGFQRNDALMLSDNARADAVPGLEIEADDVHCSHAATVGRVDEEQLFYCMSRGLSRYEAMHMIVEGFFHEVYDRIPVPAVREVLSRAVERKLGIGD